MLPNGSILDLGMGDEGGVVYNSKDVPWWRCEQLIHSSGSLLRTPLMGNPRPIALNHALNHPLERLLTTPHDRYLLL